MEPAPQLDTRTQILAAAETRFRAFGYTKTTMAEIAEDVGMSAANLYRYFQNKQDIAAACAARCLDEKVVLMREAAGHPGGASARLEAMVLAMLRYTHEQTCDHPRVNELVEFVTAERRELVEAMRGQIIGLIREVLADGRAAGELRADAPDQAETVYHAVALFGLPTVMRLHPLPRFEAYARGVVRLLMEGLRAPAA